MSYSRQTFTRTAAAFVTTLLAFSTSVAGIFRHDVPEKKYLQLGKQQQFDCVGQLAGVDTTGHVVLGASCVLVGQRYVLSAAHCFIDVDMKPDTFDTVLNGQIAHCVLYVQSNRRVKDFTKQYATFHGRKFKVKRGIVHPSYLDSLTKCPCDIALLELEQPVTSIEPARMNRSSDELHSDVTGVGYGESGRADKPESVKKENKKIAGESVVDSVGGPEFQGHTTLLFSQFVSTNDTTGKHVARPLEYTPGAGDSGGGLFRQGGNGWELVGICSGEGTVGVDLERLVTTGYYGKMISWTRLSAFTGWIAAQME
jgi:secreted trypsin-like serine protease